LVSRSRVIVHCHHFSSCSALHFLKLNFRYRYSLLLNIKPQSIKSQNITSQNLRKTRAVPFHPQNSLSHPQSFPILAHLPLTPFTFRTTYPTPCSRLGAPSYTPNLAGCVPGARPRPRPHPRSAASPPYALVLACGIAGGLAGCPTRGHEQSQSPTRHRARASGRVDEWGDWRANDA
jgi:hypothetical protein